MADIRPFRGVHYHTEIAGELDRLVGPPYDVISPEEQDALYAADPHNFVRIMLNRSEPADSETDNPYTRAATCLRDWLASGVLREDPEPALYVYQQTFTNPADGRRYQRTGLFCALTLEPYANGVVLPHEETRNKAKEDRLNLMRATQANPEPIFGLYEDEGEIASLLAPVKNEPPMLHVTVDGDDHTVWRLASADAIDRLRALFGPRRIWIADGHHRYETGLAYRAERRAAEGDPAEPQPYDSLLIILTAFNDPGIVVLPTHRLVKNIPAERLAQLPLQLERYFTVEAVPPVELETRMQADPAAGVHRFGLVTKAGAWAFTLRDEAIMDTAVQDHVDVWKRLDVSILQTLVLERSLGIPAAMLATTPHIAYTRSREEALAKVESGEFNAAFLLNMPSADEVRQVAAAGDKMPPKSTFFYPKQWSGLLLRKV